MLVQRLQLLCKLHAQSGWLRSNGDLWNGAQLQQMVQMYVSSMLWSMKTTALILPWFCVESTMARNFYKACEAKPCENKLESTHC